MTRLTLSAAKSKLARVIGCCEDSPKVAEYANEAQQRLLNRAVDPVGVWQRMTVCVGSSNCLTWPRQVMTIKAYWLCDRPGKFVSEFYETVGYASGGVGKATNCSSWDTLIDQGTVCSFDNVVSSSTATRKIQVVCSDPSDNGKTIILRYVDGNGNRVYTSIGGVVQEGEQLVMSTTGTLTASTVWTGGLYNVVKAVCNYPVRLYEYDPVNAVQTKLLAVYEPSETLPIYRSTKLPGLKDRNGCCSSSSDDDCTANKRVTIVARLQHIPVVVDNDPFVIGNLPALADMVQAILYREKHMLNEALASEANASRELDGEIAAYLGDGMQMSFHTPDGSTWGPAVTNPVGGWVGIANW